MTDFIISEEQLNDIKKWIGDSYFDEAIRSRPHTSTPAKSLHPEKYGEYGLTVGLCACVQENKGTPEKDCEYCYGTGVSVYTNIELPPPTNCPHWVNDAIYVKGFRCSLYRDVNRDIRDTTIRNQTLDAFTGFIDAYRREDEDGHDYVSVFALQNHIDFIREGKSK